MPSLLSPADITEVTGQYHNHFLTFQSNIIIHKEPLKDISLSNATDDYAGYLENTSSQQNVTFTPQSGIYSAMVTPVKKEDSIDLPSLNVNNFTEVYRFKVLDDAKNYIQNGSKNETVEYNKQYFNIISDLIEHNFQGLKMYIFFAERAK